MKINPEAVRLQINNLLVQYPELLDDDILRADMIEAETEAPEVLAMLVRRIGETEAIADGTKGYVLELCERGKRLDRRVEGLRSLIFKIMDDARLPKIELAEATISIRNGTPKVILQDAEALPEDCIRTKREPDLPTIKLKLVAGQTVPGACLSNPEPSLTIRTR